MTGAGVRAVSATLSVAFLITVYAIAVGIWGAALGIGFRWFALVGGVTGGALGLISAAAILAQPTIERVRETQVWAGMICSLQGVAIGFIGSTVLAIKLLILN